jgi:hypothetical protein
VHDNDNVSIVQAVVVLVFIVVLFFLIMETYQGWNVVQFMMLVGAMAVVCVWAMYTDDLSTWAGCLCVSAIVGLAALAYSVPIVDCSRCSVDKHTPTWTSIVNYQKECVLFQSWFNAYFGNNNEFVLINTTDGVKRKWVYCYDDVAKAWDPCNVHESVNIELSCKK